MIETEIGSLTARIGRIEAQNRRLRWALGVIVALGAVGIVGFSHIDAVSQSRTLAAERFELRRADGSLAGVFGTSAAGAVNLVLFDKQNRARATIGVSAEGSPAVVLISAGGRQSVTLADSPNGPAALLFDRSENVRWAASVEANGQPGLELRDARGAVTWKAQ
jgi:hypothetical protein